jgi:serine/threonine-protein kinase PpkA
MKTPLLTGLPGAFTLAIALTLGGLAAQAQDRPLLMEGKKQLYQRVLVRDSVPKRDGPDGNAGAQVSPLSALYVYAREGDWVQVGPSDAGGALFWLPQAAVVDWKQNIVATFETGAELGRLLFFNGLDPLYEVVESEDPALPAKSLRDVAVAAEKGGPASETIVALGPRETVDQRKNLYVMPILESEQAIMENGASTNLLKVAVARADGQKTVPEINAPVNAPSALRQGYKAGVVFVVDTTVSMEPYIRGTRDALKAVLAQVEGSDAADAISFGLIGFRDNLNGAQGLEYDVRTFVNLTEGSSSEAFLNGISTMTEARASSRNFREDSFRGVEHAISAMNWDGFDARFIVVVTDAGPRVEDDPLSATGLSASGLNTIVKEQLGAAIAVMHLRTQGGAADHASAESAYRSLTRLENQPGLYFPVAEGDAELYREEARRMAAFIVDQVMAFRGGQEPGDFEDVPEGDALTRAVSAVGQTMQLAYLGRREGTKAPDVFEAYVSDRDFERTGLKPLSIRLLINKAQLSDLTEALTVIAERGEASVINPDEFFAQVLGAAADMSRNPDDVARRADATLAEAAAIPEYLEGLPYKSRIMNITEDEYIRLPISQQQSIFNELWEKIERYKRYNQASDQWVDYLGTGGTGDNLLYPMRLDDLP